MFTIMQEKLKFFLTILVVSSVTSQLSDDNFWTYVCENPLTDSAHCVRNETQAGDLPIRMNECKLTCGKMSALWPATSNPPTIGNNLSRFTVDKISTLISCPSEVRDLASQSLDIFKNHLDMYHPDYDQQNKTAPWTTPSDPTIADHVMRIEITIGNADDRLSLTTDESYSLTMVPEENRTVAVIIGTNFFGIRHGLETLSQFINYDVDNDCLQVVNSVVLNDSPAFAYRGLILDTARNYISLEGIKRTIDAMSGSKLNTFHWHITDSQSFPFIMDSLPKMHEYGAYSKKKVYNTSDIQEVVEYARVRGVRVLPEFDAPAHVGYGWQWGPTEGLGDLAVCIDKKPWWSYCVEPPCGQLNLANPNMYDILAKVYQEYVTAFGPLDLFHYGGDEVKLECWNSTQEIVTWMQEQTVTGGSLSADSYYQQWSIFQENAHQIFTQANGNKSVTGIIWTSSLTEAGRADLYLDKDKYIIQIWTEGKDPIVTELLEKGYDVIFSNYDALYLDCGFGAWVGAGNNWCTPYKGWQTVYDNDIYALAGGDTYKEQVIGGEAALWTEQADDQNLDTRLWPRVSALGERLWTNPDSNWEQAEYRLVHHRERMVQRGVMADSVQPQYCHQYEGGCPGWGT